MIIHKQFISFAKLKSICTFNYITKCGNERSKTEKCEAKHCPIWRDLIKNKGEIVEKQKGRPRMYDKQLLEIVDTEKSIFCSTISEYTILAAAARKIGLFPVKVFKCLYIRSVKTKSKDIIKTLM